MTLFGPDISAYQAGLQLVGGTPYVAAKATEGTGWTDDSYQDFKAQAARIEALFSAYHFLRPGNAAEQAAHAYSVIGKTPAFLDWEGIKDPATGVYTSRPTMDDATVFTDAYRKLGGALWATYLPHWYWSDPAGLGSPPLDPIKQRGLALISSNYTTYSDSGPGWAAYGGMSPSLWQYTDRQPYGGIAVDYNAFRGTVAQLTQLIGGIVVLDQDSINAVVQGVHDSILNHQLGEIDLAGKPTGGTITLGVATARSRAVETELVAAIGALKLGGVDLAGLEALIEQHLAAGSVPSVIAAAVLQHLSAATAGAKP